MKAQVHIQEMRVLGGGPKGKQWRQILADVYDLPIIVPKYLEEATSMGAAVIGGVGAGLLDSFDRIESFIQFTDRVEPNRQHVERYRQIRPLFDEAYHALEPLFSKLQ
jgi:xylulokinase